jgi:phosphotransferase system  glucose/maltose/N-acetylglucosamine-specific IIC component
LHYPTEENLSTAEKRPHRLIYAGVAIFAILVLLITGLGIGFGAVGLKNTKVKTESIVAIVFGVLSLLFAIAVPFSFSILEGALVPPSIILLVASLVISLIFSVRVGVRKSHR